MVGMRGVVILKTLKGSLKIQVQDARRTGFVWLSPYHASVVCPFCDVGDTGQFVDRMTGDGPALRFKLSADVIDYTMKPSPSKALVRLDECATIFSPQSSD